MHQGFLVEYPGREKIPQIGIKYKVRSSQAPPMANPGQGKYSSMEMQPPLEPLDFRLGGYQPKPISPCIRATFRLFGSDFGGKVKCALCNPIIYN